MKKTVFKTLNHDNRERTIACVDAIISIDGNNNIITIDAYEISVHVNGNNNTVIIPAHVADVSIDLLSGKNNRIILCNSGYVSICANNDTFNTVIEVGDIDSLKLRADITNTATIETHKSLIPVSNRIVEL